MRCFFFFVCFPEATSLANGPAMTPDGGAGVTAELLLCLLHLYHTLAHCTRYKVDNVSVSSLSTQGHKTLWTTKRTWCWVVEQKLKLTALKRKEKKAHRLPLWCFPLWLRWIQLQYLWDAAALRWFSPRSPHLKSAFTVSVLVGYPNEGVADDGYFIPNL